MEGAAQCQQHMSARSRVMTSWSGFFSSSSKLWVTALALVCAKGTDTTTIFTRLVQCASFLFSTPWRLDFSIPPLLSRNGAPGAKAGSRNCKSRPLLREREKNSEAPLGSKHSGTESGPARPQSLVIKSHRTFPPISHAIFRPKAIRHLPPSTHARYAARFSQELYTIPPKRRSV